jgi:hypothetical protein
LAVPSPTQRGHGSARVGPLKTRDVRVALVADDPVSMLAVPLIVPLT